MKSILYPIQAAEVAEILAEYGVEPHEYGPVVNALRKNPKAWLDFMMKFELGLDKPDPKRALQSALTIAIAYVLGGLVPLLPYVFIPVAQKALLASVVCTIFALLVFGYANGYFMGDKPIWSALQTALIGAIASAAAFGLAKAVQGLTSRENPPVTFAIAACETQNVKWPYYQVLVCLMMIVVLP